MPAETDAATGDFYTFTTIEDPKMVESNAEAMNDLGQVVGFTYNGAESFGFLDTDGSFTTFAYPGATVTAATGIEDAGQIVGFYQVTGATEPNGYLYVDGAFAPISVPESTATQPEAINNNGEIAGDYDDSVGVVHGFTELNGVYTTLDFPGASGTQIDGINDAGEVVGLALNRSGSYQGFSDVGGNFTFIQPPQATDSWAYGVNDAGEIVGLYVDGAGVSHGFIDDNGLYTTIDVPGAYFTQAYGINSDGQILGSYGADGDKTFGFVATPTGTVPCFARGTLIETPDGERAVETLGVGDLVLTVAGFATPVVWIGHRRVDCRRHTNPQAVWPVRISAGAFGDDLPRRRLWLSPDHAVLVDGVLIPIRHLTNGTTLAQEPREAVEYWHVELAAHEVLLAEGLPAESYLETGRRTSFANGGVEALLHPVFEPHPDTQLLWDAVSYAPLVVTGPALSRVRERLALQNDLLRRQLLRSAAGV